MPRASTNSSTYYVPEFYDAVVAVCAYYLTGTGTAADHHRPRTQGTSFGSRVGNGRSRAPTATVGEAPSERNTEQPAPSNAATSSVRGDAARAAGHGMWYGVVLGASMAAVGLGNEARGNLGALISRNH